MSVGTITTGSEIFYCILSLIILLLSAGAEKSKKKGFAIAIVVVLSFVAGFRGYYVGRDTRNYIAIFSYLEGNGTFSNVVLTTLNKDAGFGFMCKVLLSIFHNYSCLFLIFAIIIYGLTIYRFWELRDKISFSIATFAFYSFYFFETMNTVRQFCAVAIVFWATRYLQKRRYIPFMISVLIATVLFHRSALLGILYLAIELFLWKDLEKIQRRLLSALVFFGVIFSGYIFSRIGIFTEQYQHYFRSAEANIGLRVIALLIIFFVSLFLYRKNYNLNDENDSEQGEQYLVRNTRIYYLLSCALGSIGYFFDYMGRIGYFFAFYQFVYFGILSRERFWQYRWILKAMMYVIIAYVLFNYIFVNNGAWHHPYQFVWSS